MTAPSYFTGERKKDHNARRTVLYAMNYLIHKSPLFNSLSLIIASYPSIIINCNKRWMYAMYAMFAMYTELFLCLLTMNHRWPPL